MVPDGRSAYDALHDTELAWLLLRGIAEQQVIGPVRFARVTGGRLDGGPLTDGPLSRGRWPRARARTAWCSPASRATPAWSTGRRPSSRCSAGWPRAPIPTSRCPPRSAGWARRTWRSRSAGWRPATGGELTILAILSRYLRAASDGWSLAATSVRDLYAQPDTSAAEAGGDFAGEAHRLGAATAEVHRDLVTAFGADELPPGAADGLAGPMRHRLADALTAVPELGEHAAMLTAAYAELAGLDEPVRVQRIHGDYHLGQVMRTQTGWVMLDFEGEPAVPLATGGPAPRRCATWRACSARSTTRPGTSCSTARTEQRSNGPRGTGCGATGEAFCAGYAEVGGAIDPRKHEVLLRAFELDKAVYEVMYEARNRPSWLSIPLDSLAAMSAARPDPGTKADSDSGGSDGLIPGPRPGRTRGHGLIPGPRPGRTQERRSGDQPRGSCPGNRGRDRPAARGRTP